MSNNPIINIILNNFYIIFSKQLSKIFNCLITDVIDIDLRSSSFINCRSLDFVFSYSFGICFSANAVRCGILN